MDFIVIDLIAFIYLSHVSEFERRSSVFRTKKLRPVNLQMVLPFRSVHCLLAFLFKGGRDGLEVQVSVLNVIIHFIGELYLLFIIS